MVSVLVAYGRSQSGKSTTVGKLRLSGQDIPQVGTGDGESITDDAYLIQTELGPMLDTPGIEDTRLRFTSNEAGRKVAIALASSGVTRVKFLIFESLANDSMQLRDTLEKFVLAFGKDALQAAVVLASKADKLKDAKVRAKRLSSIEKVVKEQQMQGVVVWQNEEIDNAGHAEQLSLLWKVLDRFDGTVIADLEDLKQRQRVRAQQKCDAQTTDIRWVDVEVDEEYMVPRQEQEPYQEPYSAVEPCTEYCDVPTQGADGTFLVNGMGSGVAAMKVMGPAGFLLGTLAGLAGEALKEAKADSVPKQRTALREVVKYRTAYRTVTHFDVKTRKVTKQVETVFRHPVEYFMDEALREIIAEIRQSLMIARSKL